MPKAKKPAKKPTPRSPVNSGISKASDLYGLSASQQKEALAQVVADAASDLDKSPSLVTHLQLRDYLKDEFGIRDAAKMMTIIQQLGGVSTLVAAYFPKQVTPLMIERAELSAVQKVNKKYENQEIYNEYFLTRLKKAVVEAYEKYPLVITKFSNPHKQRISQDTARELNVVLSDLHFQSLIKKSETGNEYGAKEEARRIASIGRQVANYKLDHRPSTSLNVLLLGDVIQNQLHDPRDGSPMVSQFQAAVYLLTQLFGYWATAFKTVTIYCSTGNHGRNTARHKTRAVHEKWDSIENQIYYAIMTSMAVRFPNVKFVIPQTPWVEYETLGHPVYATHGDTVFNPGNPGKTVDVQKLENQTNKANEARVSKGKAPYRIFVAGHVHRALEVYLDSGTTVFTNGPLCPPDGFANSIGIYNTQCGQWLWESTRQFMIGDTRLMRVGEKDDEDESLDEIIRPYMEFAQIPEITKFKRKKK